MSRQAPAPVRLEHVVGEHEGLRVRPVVLELARVVVAHETRASQDGAGRRGRRAAAVPDEPTEADADEPVHLAAVDVLHPGERPVRAAGAAVTRVVKRPDAPADPVRDADRMRDPVRTRERAEVRVERAVLLHDHDHVPDRLHAGPRARGACRRPAAGAGGRRSDEGQYGKRARPHRPSVERAS